MEFSELVPLIKDRVLRLFTVLLIEMVEVMEISGILDKKQNYDHSEASLPNRIHKDHESEDQTNNDDDMNAE